MTKGGGVFGFGAGLSLSLSLAASTSSGLGSWRISTRRVLSGDHSKSLTPWAVSVRRNPSPPRRFSSHTWLLPALREERKARYLPSGLQRGCEEEIPSAVMGIASPPWVETIQRRCSFLSSLSILVRTAYATHWPSGLISGWETSRIWK